MFCLQHLQDAYSKHDRFLVERIDFHDTYITHVCIVLYPLTYKASYGVKRVEPLRSEKLRFDYNRNNTWETKLSEQTTKGVGEFLQIASNHVHVRGCKLCGKRNTTDDVLEKAKSKHGDRYDYSKCNYTELVRYCMCVLRQTCNESITFVRYE